LEQETREHGEKFISSATCLLLNTEQSLLRPSGHQCRIAAHAPLRKTDFKKGLFTVQCHLTHLANGQKPIKYKTKYTCATPYMYNSLDDV